MLGSDQSPSLFKSSVIKITVVMAPDKKLPDLGWVGSIFCGSSWVSHLWFGFGFGFGKFPLTMSNFSIFSLWVVKSSSSWVKGGLASYLLRVKSILGSGRVGSEPISKQNATFSISIIYIYVNNFFTMYLKHDFILILLQNSIFCDSLWVKFEATNKVTALNTNSTSTIYLNLIKTFRMNMKLARNFKSCQTKMFSSNWGYNILKIFSSFNLAVVNDTKTIWKFKAEIFILYIIIGVYF